MLYCITQQQLLLLLLKHLSILVHLLGGSANIAFPHDMISRPGFATAFRTVYQCWLILAKGVEQIKWKKNLILLIWNRLWTVNCVRGPTVLFYLVWSRTRHEICCPSFCFLVLQIRGCGYMSLNLSWAQRCLVPPISVPEAFSDFSHEEGTDQSCVVTAGGGQRSSAAATHRRFRAGWTLTVRPHRLGIQPGRRYRRGSVQATWGVHIWTG